MHRRTKLLRSLPEYSNPLDLKLTGQQCPTRPCDTLNRHPLPRRVVSGSANRGPTDPEGRPHHPQTTISFAIPCGPYADAISDSTYATPGARYRESLYSRDSCANLSRYTQATRILAPCRHLLVQPQNLPALVMERHCRANIPLRQRGNGYSTTFVTNPEPTVRPPSRIAKRLPSSIAIGLPNSTSSETLSPGIHISAPPMRLVAPVTSVVRK